MKSYYKLTLLLKFSSNGPCLGRFLLISTVGGFLLSTTMERFLFSPMVVIFLLFSTLWLFWSRWTVSPSPKPVVDLTGQFIMKLVAQPPKLVKCLVEPGDCGV